MNMTIKNEYGNIITNKKISITNNQYKYYKKLLQMWQIIVTNMGATNEQTNENKVQGKNKTKFLY